MVKVVLPKMLEKKKGVIVNLSSSSGVLSPPYMTVYAASKVSLVCNSPNDMHVRIRTHTHTHLIMVTCSPTYTHYVII